MAARIDREELRLLIREALKEALLDAANAQIQAVIDAG